MRVALAPGLFFPNYYGGLEFYTLHIAHLLMQKGHHALILCIEPINHETREIVAIDETYQGIPLRRLIYNPVLRPPEERWSQVDAEVAARFSETLVSWKAEVLHITGAVSMALVPQAHKLGLPVVYTATDFSMTCSRGGRLVRSNGELCDGKENLRQCLQCQRHHTLLADGVFGLVGWLPEPCIAKLGRWAAHSPRRIGVLELARLLQYRFETLRPIVNSIDQIIAPSAWMKQTLVMNGIDERRVVVSEYGIQFDGSGSGVKNPSDHIRFGFFGRMDPLKGVHHLINAFNQLHPSHGATLTIYGAATPASRDYTARLTQMAKGNLRIRFAGLISNKEVSVAHRDLDVVVVPSLWYENSPLTVLESLACGTPVIASDVGGIRDLVQHEVNGLLFSPGNEDELREAMQRCVDRPELVQQLAAKIKPVKSIAQDVDWLIGLYNELIGRYRNAQSAV